MFFSFCREVLPKEHDEAKMTKIDTLKSAYSYILGLTELLKMEDILNVVRKEEAERIREDPVRQNNQEQPGTPYYVSTPSNYTANFAPPSNEAIVPTSDDRPFQDSPYPPLRHHRSPTNAFFSSPAELFRGRRTPEEKYHGNFDVSPTSYAFQAAPTPEFSGPDCPPRVYDYPAGRVSDCALGRPFDYGPSSRPTYQYPSAAMYYNGQR